jgi:tRNA dimethylallyltransferase
MSPLNPPVVITIQGTTASGKSDFALQLAEHLNTEIISADSRQIYKYMDIGTAKATREEQEKVKHHLIDIITPDQPYNAGRFTRDTEKIIEELNNSGQIPIIAGGTGFYIKALLEGLATIPEIPQQTNQEIIEEHSSKSDKQLHEYLKSFDPLSANRIDHQDRQKMLRAICVYQYAGKPISFFWQKKQIRREFRTYEILIIKPRELIYEKINQRVDKMLELGLIKEIELLLRLGYKEGDPGMKSVGYQELIPYFLREAELDKCIELVKQHTRNYAKRQVTWLNKYQFDLTLGQISINFLPVLKGIKESLRST